MDRNVSAYEAERLYLLRRRIFIAIAVAGPVLLAFHVLDQAIFPAQAADLLQLRFAYLVILALLLLLSTRVPERFLHVFGLVATLMIGAMVDLLIHRTGGAASPYFPGNDLVMLGVAVLLPWRPLWALATAVMLMVQYSIAAWPTAEDLTFYFTAMMFLGSTGLVATLSSALAERLRKREFETRVALAKMVDAKSEFLASVSHDLRTPLNVVMGYSELLLDGTFGPMNAEQSETMGRIVGNARSQLELVNDLLDLARIEQGKLRCSLRPTVIATLLPRLRDMMEVLLREASVSFVVDVPSDIAAVADPERLQQALSNLLTNAAKFTDRGEIRLSASRIENEVRITVADAGSGMDQSVLESALEPFVRGDESKGGWGLGLAIVARLVKLMRGQLEIRTRLGLGTTACISLPAVPLAAVELNASGERDARPELATGPEPCGRSTSRLPELLPARR